jgi:hypothetical protein
MHATLDVNLPNYAAAIVSTDEIVASISSLKGFGARQTWIEIRKAFAVESKECADGRSACYRNRGADCGLCGGTSRWRNGPTANAPKSWAEKAYPNLIHYSSHPTSRQHSSCPMRARPSGRFARRDNEKNGARVSPADLPVQNPTKFNLTIAKAPGPNVPLSLQERVGSLIE